MQLSKIVSVGLLLCPLLLGGCTSQSNEKITFGISPYQDTYLPKLAEEKGWFKEAGIDVETVTLAWGDVMNSVASPQGADIVITNLNSFLAAYGELSRQGAKPIFIYPLYVFKGPAILIHADSPLQSVDQVMKTRSISRQKAIEAAAAQLKGANIITTEGTEMEQIVLAAAQKAGLKPGEDFQITHASPEDGLAAFLGGQGTA